jgi:hypothetical protein
VFLLADKGMEQVITGFLGREYFHRSLGCARFSFNPSSDLIVSPTKDSGMLKYASGLLRSYEKSHERPVVVVDADWTGTPGASVIRERLEQSLSAGWKQFAVIVIEPELEAWIMSDTPHLARIFRCPDNCRQVLAGAGYWPDDAAKPPRPKEALEYLKRQHKSRGFKADFGKLAAAMSVRQCQDAAFLQLRDHLRAWFPEQS